MNLDFLKKDVFEKKTSGPLPSKTSINFAEMGVQKINRTHAIIGIAIIIVLACVFSKFFVVDKLLALNAINSEVNQLDSTCTALTEKIAKYDDLTKKYAHYTYNGFTAEELSVVSSVDVMDIIDQYVKNQSTIYSWAFKDNTISLSFSSGSLEKIKEIAREMEKDERVSYAQVYSASTETTGREVVASVAVYLNGGN